jgi:cobalt/nickel transport system permease protein
VSFCLLFTAKIPFTAILRSIVLPAFLALFMMLIKGLHEGERVWLSFSIAGYDVVLREEGLWNGLQICSKALGGVSLIILFSFTTTISRLCTGLQWFRVPSTIIDLLALIYRYIFLFLDEVDTMWTAQRTRLGHTTWKKTIRSFGTLGGMLFIRAIDRTERIHEAMHSRGYEGGRILTAALPPLNKKEYLCLIGIISITAIFIYTGNV